MTIEVGDRLPEATFKIMTEEGAKDITSTALFKGRKLVLFGVPGAFTPSCNNNHLPGFLENRDAFLEKGVDAIAVVAVNDVFVMGAWQNFSGGVDKLLYLADGSGDFVKAAGLDIDLSARGLGLRSKRFSMIVEDGVVKALNVEDVPSDVSKTAAAVLLEQL